MDTSHIAVVAVATVAVAMAEAAGVEIDVPLVYADYYFLEALNRKLKLN